MHVIKTYEQSGIFDPTNPTQYKREVFVGGTAPGGYASYYFNTVPNTSQLSGLRGGLGFWSSIPGWGQAALVGLIAVGAGYIGWGKFGPSVKRKLGLSGSRRRR